MKFDLKFKVLIIFTLIMSITVAHFSTDISVHNIHHIYRRLYYIPIILASFWFGLWGGIFCALFISVIYMPHLLFQHRAPFFGQLNMYLEVVLFNLIGLITGILSSAQMKEKKKYQQIALELENNLKEIKNLQIFNENILNSIQSGVITIDRNKKITLVNPSAKQILGDSLKKGATLPEYGFQIPHSLSLTKEETHPNHHLSKEGRGDLSAIKKDIKEVQVTLNNGRRLVLEVGISELMNHKGMVMGNVIVFADHTEKKELELQLARAERLSELGEMAAGIAHEIKNPLYSIKGSAEIISEDFKECDKKYNIVKIMISEIDRLNNLINEFLMFARPKEPTFIETDLYDLIRKTLEIVKFKFSKSDKIIEFVTNKNISSCHVDPEQVKQVLINIIFNALEAVYNNDNGYIKINIMENCSNVIVDVIDNGPGISEGCIEKIFTPFFSTKDSGVGLGLSISQKLIESNNGKISVTNNRNGGCCFSIYLPLSK